MEYFDTTKRNKHEWRLWRKWHTGTGRRGRLRHSWHERERWNRRWGRYWRHGNDGYAREFHRAGRRQ